MSGQATDGSRVVADSPWLSPRFWQAYRLRGNRETPSADRRPRRPGDGAPREGRAETGRCRGPIVASTGRRRPGSARRRRWSAPRARPAGGGRPTCRAAHAHREATARCRRAPGRSSRTGNLPTSLTPYATWRPTSPGPGLVHLELTHAFAGIRRELEHTIAGEVGDGFPERSADRPASGPSTPARSGAMRSTLRISGRALPRCMDDGARASRPAARSRRMARGRRDRRRSGLPSPRRSASRIPRTLNCRCRPGRASIWVAPVRATTRSWT